VGSGGKIAIPAARRGASVVGLDITPELFEHARRRAVDAGVEMSRGRCSASHRQRRTPRGRVAARAVLEPQGRWPELLQAVADLVRRFNASTDGRARLPAEYLLITVDR
jgi:cyclopropane fatty-acyl-phospholipid synthase-like methyltransferase